MNLVLIKPDALQRGIAGLLIHEYESRYRIADLALRWPDRAILEAHYMEHAGKVFYHDLILAMRDRHLMAMKVVQLSHSPPIREFTLGLREKYGADREGPRNLLHCSDSKEAAIRESKLWFL